MARQAGNQAKSTYNADTALTGSSEAGASGLLNQLTPQFEQEATNPQGFSPIEKSAMVTGSEQATGGANAGAVGEAGLMAARNRNAGSFAPALDKSAHDVAKINSNNQLGIETADANLKERQRQEGIGGLSGLYNTANSDVLSSLGLRDQATNSETQAGNSGWFQNTLGTLNSLAGIGKAAGSLGYQPFGGGGGDQG